MKFCSGCLVQYEQVYNESKQHNALETNCQWAEENFLIWPLNSKPTWYKSMSKSRPHINLEWFIYHSL